jgi:hypothetical protein
MGIFSQAMAATIPPSRTESPSNGLGRARIAKRTLICAWEMKTAAAIWVIRWWSLPKRCPPPLKAKDVLCPEDFSAEVVEKGFACFEREELLTLDQVKEAASHLLSLQKPQQWELGKWPTLAITDALQNFVTIPATAASSATGYTGSTAATDTDEEGSKDGSMDRSEAEVPADLKKELPAGAAAAASAGAPPTQDGSMNEEYDL